jgi:hypothetical protein
MRFGLWNVRSVYRAGSLMTVSRELSKYKLDLVGVQWHRTCGEDTFFYGKGNKNHELGTCSFVCKRIISAVKRAEFSDKMSYITYGQLQAHGQDAALYVF